jgi:tRNA-intron endonuclease, archaea type
LYMIQAQFSGEKVMSNGSSAFSLYEKSRFGEKVRGRIEYSFVEVLYLVEEGKMNVVDGRGKQIEFNDLVKKMRRKDKRVELKFSVFSDMRGKGYVVKTALKFGADFRVYDKGVKPGENHALWVLFVVRENEALRWHDFAAKNRVAHSTKKKLLLGIVDDEGDVSYYECGWKKI